MMARSFEAEKRPGGKTNQDGFNNKKKEKSGNGKMGGLNKGNKEVGSLSLSELFSVLTNVNLKCSRVSGTGFDSNTRYIYFYLRVELQGWSLPRSLLQYMGIYVFQNTSRRVRSHFDCD